MSVYKYKWSQHICSFPLSQLQDCRFFEFQEALNSSINVKNGSPPPIFLLNRTQTQRPSQVMFLPYFAQPRKKSSWAWGLWNFPQNAGRGATTPNPTQEELHGKEGYRGTDVCTAQLGWSYLLLISISHFSSGTQKLLGFVDTIWPASSIPTITKWSNNIRLSLTLDGLRFSSNKLYK